MNHKVTIGALCLAMGVPWAVLAFGDRIADAEAASVGDIGETVTKDFGNVPLEGAGIALEHTFSLRNNSPETRTVRAVKSSCGCTQSGLALQK